MKKCLVLLLFSILSISCKDIQKREQVVVEYESSINPLVEMVSSIEIIPLETDSIHIIGSQKDLLLGDDSYIIADAAHGNIFRYSLDGKFLNRIGNTGRGPEEFTHINNVQLVDSLLYIFSNPSKQMVFKLNGDFVSSKLYRDDFFGEMSYWTQSGLLTYYGFDSVHDHRLGLIKGEDLTYYLRSKEKVMHYSPLYPIYSSRKDSIFFVDSYSSSVKLYIDGKVSSYYSFDLGKYNIPQEFYRFATADEATSFLMRQKFAMISSFYCDDESHFLEIIVQKPPHPEAYYGYEHENAWHWFGAGKLGEDIFANSFKALKGGNLYCLLDPSLIDTFPTALLEKVEDKSVLSEIDKNDNYVIAILKNQPEGCKKDLLSCGGVIRII